MSLDSQYARARRMVDGWERACLRRQTAAGLVLFAGLIAEREAKAQCGAMHSTCSACHDGMQASAPSHEAWHDDHAFADLCTTCHDGRGEAKDPAEAHVGLVEPLGKANGQCGSCHGESAQAFVDRYRTARGGNGDSGAPVAISGPANSTRTPPPPRALYAHGEAPSNFAMGAVVVTVGALALFFVVHRERILRVRAESSAVDAASRV
jgi:hypothetical protein